jgi:GNAT superfamily N-acetyltransferase
MGELVIRKATEADVTAVTALLARCIEEMRRRGIDQWDDVYPTRERFEIDVSAGSLYVASSGANEIVGAFTLDENQDAEYAAVTWTIRATRVAVVHRLMVDPSVQGRGIARELMKSAERLASSVGCAAMRLDAFAQNPQALGLYKAMAYRDAGEVRFRKGRFRCFEKQLAHPVASAGPL